MILRIHRALCTIPNCAVCLFLDDLDVEREGIVEEVTV